MDRPNRPQCFARTRESESHVGRGLERSGEQQPGWEAGDATGHVVASDAMVVAETTADRSTTQAISSVMLRGSFRPYGWPYFDGRISCAWIAAIGRVPSGTRL